MLQKTLLCLLCPFFVCYTCDAQAGPDPWDYKNHVTTKIEDNAHVPPDLKMYPRKTVESDKNLGSGEWFFRRILAIMMKGGQVKMNEDGSVDISMQMKFDENRWRVLNEYITSNMALSEEMFRRSIGYVEEAIYKPTITDKIAMAWSEYIHANITAYKTEITWTFIISSIIGIIIWLWSRISHRHIIIIIVIALYVYEVFISYKEAEKQELDRFLYAVNTCKWYFWASTCEVPAPDPLIFIKHMNPLKIGIRMFTTIISEPMVTISSTINVMIHGITDGLWFPFDKIVYGLLIIVFNTLLIFLLVMVFFNFILNIPFKLSVLGLVSIGVKQRNTGSIENANRSETTTSPGDRISIATVDKILDVCSRALNNTQNNNVSTRFPLTNTVSGASIRRSASTGRLPSSNAQLADDKVVSEYSVRKRYKIDPALGGGDAP